MCASNPNPIAIFHILGEYLLYRMKITLPQTMTMHPHTLLQEYAREGLRTLVCAKKDLTIEEYSAWAEKYQQAR